MRHLTHLPALTAVATGLTLAAGAPAQTTTGATAPAATAPADAAVSGTLIVLNKAEATGSFVDLASGREIAKFETGAGPHEVVVSPDGRTAVVANYGQREPGHTLTVVDVPSRAVRKVIDLKGHHRPHGILYMGDGRRVVVTTEVERKLLVVDVEAGVLDAAIDTGARVSHMVALAPDAKRAYVSAIGSGVVTVIDLETREAIRTIETGDGAEGLDVTPDGREVWVGNRAADTLSVIDAATLEVVETVPCAAFPIRVKITPDGRRALVSNARSGDVAVFDVATRREVDRVAMNESAVGDRDDRLFGEAFGKSPVPVGILVHPGGTRAYVANTNADVVTEIDLAALRITRRLVAGREPDGMALVPAGRPGGDGP